MVIDFQSLKVTGTGWAQPSVVRHYNKQGSELSSRKYSISYSNEYSINR